MTTPSITLPAGTSLSAPQLGALFGIGAVAIWGAYLALARAGVTSGLTGMDFALIRYGTAGLVVIPWLLANRPATLAGVGWGRAAILALLAGPAFILLGVGGYAFAPLAHGAVAQPAAVVVGTTVLATLFLGDRPGIGRYIGIGAILAGLAVIAGPGLLQGDARTPIGDAMFVGAGLLWAAFTVLCRRWGVKALPATAAVSVASMLAIVPVYLLTQDLSRLAAAPAGALVTQILVQGVLSGVVAVVLFSRAAETIGAARAAIFPALVPPAAILIGIPVTGEWPTLLQVCGLAVVFLGLLVAMGVVRIGGGPRA